MSEPFPLALHVTASAAVVRGCCGQPDTDCACPPQASRTLEWLDTAGAHWGLWTEGVDYYTPRALAALHAVVNLCDGRESVSARDVYAALETNLGVAAWSPERGWRYATSSPVRYLDPDPHPRSTSEES